jgi:tRNA nucleotidyltransferase (CCA-adding enzyme)
MYCFAVCLLHFQLTITASGIWQQSKATEAGKGMPDYIYLLENRLSPDQQSALSRLREAAREAGTILFLTGDAVRDLTSGNAVRELEVSIHGNALKLKKPIEKLGAKVWGEDEASRTLYLCFPGTVRVNVVSTHTVEYPKPGKPVFHSSSIHEDLRRRDFTVNAMALSLNEGSFGLLMDPLNGAADIEFRTLRLVSNYGFIEDPSLLIRATRYKARLGWELDPKSQTRYENSKNDGVIEHLTEHSRSRELEQIGHEEEGLKVLQALEAEGWMQYLFPAWTAAKADEAKLTALHDLAVALLVQGVQSDTSAAQMRLLTAGLSPKDLAALKKSMLRPGFVEEWDSLDEQASAFSKVLLSKQYTTPSEAFKLFMSYDPEAILWLGFTGKSAAVQEKYDLFLKVWPEARQRIPYALMQEMRITPELPAYNDIVHQIFLQLIDDKLTTPEEMRAFLEPHSPPAPPPQVTIKRPRAKRGAEAKIKVLDDDEDAEETLNEDEDLDDMGGDDDDFPLAIPKGDLDSGIPDESDSVDEGEDDLDDEDEVEPAPAAKKAAGKKASAAEVAVKASPVAMAKAPKAAAAPAPEKPTKPAPAAAVHAPVAKKSEPAAKAKPAPPVVKKMVPAVKAVKPAKPAAKPVSKPAPGKPAAKAAAKQAKPAAKSKPAPAKESKHSHAEKSSKKKPDNKKSKKH